MHGRENKIVIIENGQLSTYSMDNKSSWEIGRPSKDNHPDIKLYSPTISRKHGKFRNTDGIWFYVDSNGKNGTVYNEKRITTGIHGRVKPVMLNDGDVFIFGGGDEAVINSKTVWGMFYTGEYDDNWRIADTKGMSEVVFMSGMETITYNCPPKGTVVRRKDGLAIYMGDITYLCGKMTIAGNS